LLAIGFLLFCFCFVVLFCFVFRFPFSVGVGVCFVVLFGDVLCVGGVGFFLLTSSLFPSCFSYEQAYRAPEVVLGGEFNVAARWGVFFW